MTGPEHYAEAERLTDIRGLDCVTAATRLAQAQVHATLALAAATALSAVGATTPERRGWMPILAPVGG